ncbi:transposon Tf2-8 polyprotein [Trichonephila clavipes]|nr:transposon Tf2-8 polyprotein [Trichonephila clavipes]
MYKNALKEDLIRVVEDLDGTVESTDTIAKLKTKIEKSSTFEKADHVRKLLLLVDIPKTPLKIDHETVNQRLEITIPNILKDKIKIAIYPVLHIFKQGAKLELHTDASKFGYGAILLQQSDDNKLHPVHYFSKKTPPQEEKYSSYELEVLAVIESLKKFRNYLVGNKFKIVTGCSAFQKTMSKKQLTPKIARWALFLEDFNYEIIHRPGKQMGHVDCLSRYPVMSITYDEITTKLANCQRNDEYINSLKTLLENKQINDFVVKNDVLYKIENDNDVLVVPQQMQTEIVKNIHSKGHLGINKTESMSTSSRDALEKLKQQEITFGNPHRIITDKENTQFNDFTKHSDDAVSTLDRSKDEDQTRSRNSKTIGRGNRGDIHRKS